MHNQSHEGTDDDRREGRQWGQGWYLEDVTSHCLLNQGFWPNTRVEIWGQEVDVVAGRDEKLSMEPNRVAEPVPSRLLVSCVDWFKKKRITPCRLWRLIALSSTVRAEPMLVHNQRAHLTGPAQDIAERWRVRLVTDEQLQTGTVIPSPESPKHSSNPPWPTPLDEDFSLTEMSCPDYYR